MIKVLVVEDTPVIRDYIVHILNSDPGIQVMDTACNGEEAIDFMRQNRPDVITMDIHMPKMDGFEATRRIMETTPVPIVIVSGSFDPSETSFSFRAIEAGAVTITARPQGIGHPDHETQSKTLVQTVKLMSEVKVVRRWPGNHRRQLQMLRPQTEPAETGASEVAQTKADIRIIAMGASTGGPMTINSILAALSEPLPVPVLIVQHIANGFVDGFVEWLNVSSKPVVSIAVEGERVQAGKAYVAPDGFHMGIRSEGTIELNGDVPENGVRPSISYLFRSVAGAYGRHAAGVLLTGMGKDGAEELLLMRNKGCVTIAQDEASSVIFGMPQEAIRCNAAQYVMPPEMIAKALEKLTARQHKEDVL